MISHEMLMTSLRKQKALLETLIEKLDQQLHLSPHDCELYDQVTHHVEKSLRSLKVKNLNQKKKEQPRRRTS